jgi:hypothetical protein
MRNPRTPFLPETTPSQHVQKKPPVHMIIGLLNIQLANHLWNARIDAAIHTFISKKN